MKDNLLNSLKHLLLSSVDNAMGEDTTFELEENNSLQSSPRPIHLSDPTANSFRIYNEEEIEKFTPESRDMLSYLEQLGLIDTKLREQLIEALLQSDSTPVGPEEIKWALFSLMGNGQLTENTLLFLEFVLSRHKQDNHSVQ